MNQDFSWLACVVSGSVPSVVRENYQTGVNPLNDFSYLERQGATLFTKDSLPRKRRLLHRAMGSRFLPAHAVAEKASRFKAVLCVADDIGIPVQIAMDLQRSQTPLVVGVHGHFLRNRKFKIWARRIRGRKDVHLMPISDTIRTALMRDFEIPSSQCTTLCPPVDTEFFSPRMRPPQSPPLVLSAGAAHRDYDTLLAVVPQINASFRIASGSSWTTSALAPQMPGNCDMRPAGSMQDLRDLYAASSFVVLPLEDTFHASGIAVAVEAMAMGKTMVITQTEAAADFFLDNETCLMVPPADGPALKSAILRLLNDPALQARLGAAALSLMETRYSLAAYGKALTELVERVCADTNRMKPTS